MIKSLGLVDATMLILDENGENLKVDLDLWPRNDLEG